MKRVVAIFLCVLITVVSESCTMGNNSEYKANGSQLLNQEDQSGNNANKDNGDKTLLQKLEGTLTHCTAFSEGLAFATVEGDEENVYCINSQKEIVFSVKKPEEVSLGWLTFNGKVSFASGLAYLNGFFGGGLCDKTGKITMPEDVGVTKFYDSALEGGYIIAEVTTSDYENTVQKLGIMNTNFEWIYKPTEELFAQVQLASPYDDVYFNDHLYLFYSENILNLKTGQIVDSSVVPVPAEAWVFGGSNSFYDPIQTEIVRLNLSDKANLTSCSRFSFGTSVLIYHNRSAQKYYFNLINAQGEFLFEPVEISNYAVQFVAKSEKVIVLMAGKVFYSYDNEGNLLGSVDMSLYNDKVGWNSGCFISDQAIVINGNVWGLGWSTDLAYIFDKNLVEQ